MPNNITRPESIGTNQHPWKLGLPRGATQALALCSANETAPGAGTYVHVTRTSPNDSSPTRPADRNMTTGVFPIAIEPSNQLALKFYMSDAALETGEAYVYGCRRLGPNSPETGNPQEWCCDLLGTLTFTAGAATVATGSTQIPPKATDGDSVRWADAIADTNDGTFSGWTIYANNAGGAAIAVHDSTGYSEYIVVLRTGGSCEACGFIYTEF